MRPSTIGRYLLVPARWVPVNEYWIVELRFWNVLPAVLGSVSVRRRLSDEPAVSDDRPDIEMLDPMTARDETIVVVVPAHVYVKAGLEPDSTQATEHLSTTICSPFVASVSSALDVVALVVSATDARSTLPLLLSVNERCIVSPGTMFVAFTVRRFVDAPVAPSAIVTVPDDTVCEADVVLVNVANVPRPAIEAAQASAATLIKIFFVRVCGIRVTLTGYPPRIPVRLVPRAGSSALLVKGSGDDDGAVIARKDQKPMAEMGHRRATRAKRKRPPTNSGAVSFDGDYAGRLRVHQARPLASASNVAAASAVPTPVAGSGSVRLAPSTDGLPGLTIEP